MRHPWTYPCRLLRGLLLLLPAAEPALRAVNPLPVVIRWEVDPERGYACWTYLVAGRFPVQDRRRLPSSPDWALMIHQIRVTIRSLTGSGSWTFAIQEPGYGPVHEFTRPFRVIPPTRGEPVTFQDLMDYGSGLPLPSGFSLGAPCIEPETNRIVRVEILADYRPTLPPAPQAPAAPDVSP